VSRHAPGGRARLHLERREGRVQDQLLAIAAVIIAVTAYFIATQARDDLDARRLLCTYKGAVPGGVVLLCEPASHGVRR
jgi:hypothetical protein